MAYQINYGQAGNNAERKTIPDGKRVNTKHMLLYLCVVLICAVAVVWCVPQLRAGVAQLLLPGDPQITSAALEDLISALQDGQTIQTALTQFCREIIDHGLQAA